MRMYGAALQCYIKSYHITCNFYCYKCICVCLFMYDCTTVLPSSKYASRDSVIKEPLYSDFTFYPLIKVKKL